MCCKCCQYCLESCYWHLIEKRFCWDDSIALYEEPEKEEKNNNMFDNLAFYDSVAVIAGRSVVTIEPLPEKEKKTVQPVHSDHTLKTQVEKSTDRTDQPSVHQPTKRLQWREDNFSGLKSGYFSRSVPLIFERRISEEDLSRSTTTIAETICEDPKETDSISDDSDKPDYFEAKTSAETPASHLTTGDVEIRRKSLLERRQSKSLYLKIDHHKEIPIIRQNSMPKFYLETPEACFTESAICKVPSSALTSPVRPHSTGFVFDLYTVVQMEKNRINNCSVIPEEVPVHRDERSSKLAQVRNRIKLRRVKSSLATTFAPHHTHHM